MIRKTLTLRAKTRHIAASLAACRSGVAMTEFALALPLLMTAGMFGAETTWMTLAHMRVSQTALHLADNASRIGDTSALQNRRIYEGDIGDLMYGALVQAGSLDLFENGRVVISSLEVYDETVHCETIAAGGECASDTADDGEQFINWQRCMGEKNALPQYGAQGDIVAAGMGPLNNSVSAGAGIPVIFVEVTYDYDPLFTSWFVANETIFETASFVVRDNRDLTQIYQRSVADPDEVWLCNRFENHPLAAAAL